MQLGVEDAARKHRSAVQREAFRIVLLDDHHRLMVEAVAVAEETGQVMREPLVGKAKFFVSIVARAIGSTRSHSSRKVSHQCLTHRMFPKQFAAVGGQSTQGC